MYNLRRADKIQLWCTGFGLIFLLTVVLLAQSQETINATVSERLTYINLRLDRIEGYLTATIVALISNLVAHVVSIQASRGNRAK